MKLTNKQKQEIDFLTQVWPDKSFESTQEEVEEFINYTIKGVKIKDGRSGGNRIFQNKRNLEISAKMWIDDILDMRLSLVELQEDFNHPYTDHLIDSIRKQVVRKRRQLKQNTGSPFLTTSGKYVFNQICENKKR